MHTFESVLEVSNEYRDTINIKAIKEIYNVVSKLSIHLVSLRFAVQTIKYVKSSNSVNGNLLVRAHSSILTLKMCANISHETYLIKHLS